MKVAFIIYNGMTTFDFIGAFEPITKLKTMEIMPDLKWDVCAFKQKVVKDQVGLEIVADKLSKTLKGYDTILVPGGPGSRKLVNNPKFIDWIRTAKNSKLKVSVCTGALLIGAAGFLEGKTATTHHSAFDFLAKYCSRVIRNQRIVDEGDAITAGGVTAALDLGMYLCEKWAGEDAAKKISKQIEYSGYLSKKSIAK
jgi:transcriptional regulator GlxA family with amidase domain